MKDKLLEAAKTIKDYCANDGVYHEEECPFFLGYDNDNNSEQYKTVRCALNLGHTSPSNWDVQKFNKIVVNAKHLENKYPDAFLLQRNGGIIMNTSRFTITTIVENGYPHYKVYDNLTGNEIHCDLNELNETIWELLGVQEMVL